MHGKRGIKSVGTFKVRGLVMGLLWIMQLK